jgi:hypothetical protein
MSAGAAIVLVLAAIVAIALASFFRHMLIALLVLLGLPFVLLLDARIGSLATISLVVVVVAFGALVHTISDTLGLVRSAQRTQRPPRVRRSEQDRSRIAA